MRLALLASGRGSNVAAILGAIADGRLRADPVLLLCDRPGAPAIDVAAAAGVPVAVVARGEHPVRAAWDAAVLAALHEARPDLIALGGFASVLGPSVVRAFEGRILNIHPSLLPAFAGSVAPGPQAAALAAGVPVSGCTVHLVTSAVDDGPILAQAEVPVLAGDTVESLSDRILAAEHRLYPEVIGRLSSRWGG
jgi:formyltetrahydrofolate-dependent phosphoribosylglycinamide formyltransferase